MNALPLQWSVGLLVAAVVVPLAAVPAVTMLRRPLALLPWAALPGLVCALLSPLGTHAELPMLVIGMSFELDGTAAVFLGFGSLLWLLAGIYAAGSMAGSPRLPSFVVFWLLTLSGTLTTFVAADAATFYVGFSMMSLASYGLVVHDRTPAAWRAGRIYIILAVLGETAMLAGLMLAASYAESLGFDHVRAALSAPPWGGVALAGLIIGLGMKAGLAPLHVWLPLAHTEAPTPASAVLSGVIVKAGIIGLIRLLPVEAASVWGEALTVVGLGTAYYGVVCGLLQKAAKAILAYSTLSQMGLVVALLGSGVGAVEPTRHLDGAVLYASHHGLAKGALFLGVGVVAAAGSGRGRLFALALTGFAAASVAGLPLTGGAMAKLAIKTPMGTGTAALLVTLSAVGTGLLMIRFLWVLAGPTAPAATAGAAVAGGRDGPGEERAGWGAPWRRSLPWAASAAAALMVPGWLFGELADDTLAKLVSPANLFDGAWPILAALGIVLAARRLWRARLPSMPRGDLVVVGEAVAGRVPRALAAAAPAARRP
jgi:formate hydrogenlyase subunit 3/multisubunit Na+/H+ antiporter MnhD subunit